VDVILNSANTGYTFDFYEHSHITVREIRNVAPGSDGACVSKLCVDGRCVSSWIPHWIDNPCSGGSLDSYTCGSDNHWTLPTPCEELAAAPTDQYRGNCEGPYGTVAYPGGFYWCDYRTCLPDQYRTGYCGGITNGYSCNTCSNINCAENHYRAGYCSGTHNGYTCPACTWTNCNAGYYRRGAHRYPPPPHLSPQTPPPSPASLVHHASLSHHAAGTAHARGAPRQPTGARRDLSPGGLLVGTRPPNLIRGTPPSQVRLRGVPEGGVQARHECRHSVFHVRNLQRG
jgi:hypothetical protein